MTFAFENCLSGFGGKGSAVIKTGAYVILFGVFHKPVLVNHLPLSLLSVMDLDSTDKVLNFTCSFEFCSVDFVQLKVRSGYFWRAATMVCLHYSYYFHMWWCSSMKLSAVMIKTSRLDVKCRIFTLKKTNIFILKFAAL